MLLFGSVSSHQAIWQLIEEFRKRTDVPVVLNTSLNWQGEPIVDTPADVLRWFFSSGLDAVIMGEYLVEKRNQRLKSMHFHKRSHSSNRPASAFHPERPEMIGGNMAIADLMEAFETHSPNGIKEALANGVSPLTLIDGHKPIDCLIESYLRSSLFADCLRVMLDAGATIDDPLVEALLLDDASGLQHIITKSPQGLHQQLDFLAAFTSCRGVTALHVCAEFNCVKCARVLIESGADVNATAACDADGVGGQTPIFHAVNSIFNYCRPVMELLAEAGADLQVKLRSLLWGEAMSWETVLYDVTPISYAQCGMYRQFHRREDDIYSNLQYLYRRAHNTEAVLINVPNKYLVEGH